MKRLAVFLILALVAAHVVAMTAAVRPDEPSHAGPGPPPALASGAATLAGRP